MPETIPELYARNAYLEFLAETEVMSCPLNQNLVMRLTDSAFMSQRWIINTNESCENLTSLRLERDIVISVLISLIVRLDQCPVGHRSVTIKSPSLPHWRRPQIKDLSPAGNSVFEQACSRATTRSPLTVFQTSSASMGSFFVMRQS